MKNDLHDRAHLKLLCSLTFLRQIWIEAKRAIRILQHTERQCYHRALGDYGRDRISRGRFDDRFDVRAPPAQLAHDRVEANLSNAADRLLQPVDHLPTSADQ